MNGMKRHLAAALVALATGAAAADTPGAWQLSLRADHHSDGLPLADLSADDPLQRLAPRAGRNIAYADDELRASRRAGASTWSLVARQQATLATNDDTLRLLLQASGRAPTAVDQRWNATLRYRQFAGVGVEFGHRFAPAEAWQATLAVQGLQLRHWRERRIAGPVDYTAATGTYRFNLASHEADDRIVAPFQQPFARRGAGLLLHGELAWDAQPWRISLGVRDLGWLHWRGLPQQDLVLATDTRAVDADGYVIYAPLVQGRDSQGGHTRRLGGWWTARAAWSFDTTRRLELSAETLSGFGVLPALAWQQDVGEAALSLGWRVHEQRLTVGLGWRGLALRLGADRLGPEAQSRDIGLSYTATW